MVYSKPNFPLSEKEIEVCDKYAIGIDSLYLRESGIAYNAIIMELLVTTPDDGDQNTIEGLTNKLLANLPSEPETLQDEIFDQLVGYYGEPIIKGREADFYKKAFGVGVIVKLDFFGIDTYGVFCRKNNNEDCVFVGNLYKAIEFCQKNLMAPISSEYFKEIFETGYRDVFGTIWENR